MSKQKIKVAVNGYGVIGRRVADAILLQKDMTLVGVSDIATDWRIKSSQLHNFQLYSFNEEKKALMEASGLTIYGTLDELLEKVDVVVDCSPKKMGAENVKKYQSKGIKFILQGGEKHEMTGHSFVAESNYESALNRNSTRVVSCNTTSIIRTLGALKRKGLLKRARGTLLRRASDPMEGHKEGIVNTIVPEEHIPSHQGPDAQSVDHSLDVITMAVTVPENVGHVHFWNVELTRIADRAEILDAFRESPRIAFVKMKDGLTGINTIKELMADLGRSRANLYEVALWEDLLQVKDNEVFYAYMVDNQAIVIPETIDAIRALMGTTLSALESIQMTNKSLEINGSFLKDSNDKY